MFDIIDFFMRIFHSKKGDTRHKARERLKLILVSDRASISPKMMESLRKELIEVVSRYMTIDISSVEMGVERKKGALALAANIPIIDLKRERKKRGKGDSVDEKKEIKEVKKETKEEAVKKEEPSPSLEEVSKKVTPPKKVKSVPRRYRARAGGRNIRKKAPAG